MHVGVPDYPDKPELWKEKGKWILYFPSTGSVDRFDTWAEAIRAAGVRDRLRYYCSRCGVRLTWQNSLTARAVKTPTRHHLWWYCARCMSASRRGTNTTVKIFISS